MLNRCLRWIGMCLVRWLSRPRHTHSAAPSVNKQALTECLQVGDVLLVDGNNSFSISIKYLTQSTWSHAALYVGPHPQLPTGHCFIEADLIEGVRSVGIEAFTQFNCRLCRPVGLTAADSEQLVQYAIARLGNQYDLRNIIDLARYLLPTPPVPMLMRRRMLALGSGDPTRAICSTLIAQAFQSIRYPILPRLESRLDDSPDCPGCIKEILHIRHYSLFVPRDFDLSPYFLVIKPVATQIDYHSLSWQDS
ncbi:MAG: YiiX/YebB-like N1pC/P60 family cysteine hydrolase [Moraxellaceae bacterium]|nr:YiiX/YebB-like N1pC/P60 family cysteine hydrolase [Moraxellaceae bacterium]MDZ4385716.1 YiiX/YebB-like N1pC/P60 family cysteine hydrolase [Moraxellaceae bacterium]